MNKYTPSLLLAFLFFFGSLGAQTTLSHNVGNNVIPNNMYSCSWGGVCWGRKFILSDFGIAPNQNFTINSGQVGLFYGVNWDTNLQFNIYAIDSAFPASFSELSLIGSSQVVPIPMSGSASQIINVNFMNPVEVPAGTAMILVEVFQLHSSSSEAHAFVAGTEFDNDFSWFRSKNVGCPPTQYTTTIDLGRPNAKFYITVSGEVSTLSTAENHERSGNVTYPNPVQNELFFNTSDEVFKIEVYDVTGRLIKTPEVYHNKVNLDQLPSGNYFLKIHKNTGVTNAKIIKE